MYTPNEQQWLDYASQREAQRQQRENERTARQRYGYGIWEVWYLSYGEKFFTRTYGVSQEQALKAFHASHGTVTLISIREQ